MKIGIEAPQSVRVGDAAPVVVRSDGPLGAAVADEVRSITASLPNASLGVIASDGVGELFGDARTDIPPARGHLVDCADQFRSGALLREVARRPCRQERLGLLLEVRQLLDEEAPKGEAGAGS